MRLDGKRLIITGAGGGIGRACTRLAAAAGARLVLAGRTARSLEEAAGEAGTGERARIYPCDVTSEKEVRALFAEAAAAWGGVDGLVHCAAVFRSAAFAQMPLDLWRQVLDANLNGTFLCCREAFRVMRPGGVIVNVGSLSGVPGVEKFPGFAAYNVSKYGVIGLTELLGVEGRPLGLRVNCVSPAAVDTPMLRQAAPQLPPAMTPNDVARVILFLLSEESRAATGENIILTGAPAAFHAG